MRLDAFDDGGRAVLVKAWEAARSAHHGRIGSGYLLRACLDVPELRILLARHGLDVDGARRALPAPAPDRELLAAIGLDIDPTEIRDRLRRRLGIEASVPVVYRRRSHPLQIVFAGDGRCLVASPGARKVLEVALWRSRGSRRPDWRLRQERPATSLDLLAGLLSDHRNPMVGLLADHGLRIRPALLADLELA